LTGRISHPLYLWHWPLLVLAEAFKFGTLTVLERGLVVAVSFIRPPEGQMASRMMP
jgi:peptidoglycan/LPS O-acetylase OafA/YrhL